MISNCNQKSKNNIVSVAENKRVFRILNTSQKEINKVRVDGCYITIGPRCDWLFEVIHNDVLERVLYVELKGSDIPHAIVQLEATIKHCKDIHERPKKEAFVVASKVPKAGTSSQVLKKIFYQKNKIQLFMDTNIKEITI